MTHKWIGAVFVLVGCGGTGFSMAASYRREERLLHQMITMLQYMENELQYRLTPLPELCRQAGAEISGVLHDVMVRLASELDNQISPDVCSCMESALRETHDVPKNIRRSLLRMGHTLGRFDLPGQLQGLQAVQAECRRELTKYENNRDIRLKSYQTLGLCAGAALAILFA